MPSKRLKIISVLLNLLIVFSVIPFSIVHAGALDNVAISVTDNKTAAANNSNIDYTLTIRNNSDDDISGIVGLNTLPEFVDFVSSDIPGFQVSGKDVSFIIESISAHQQINFRVSGRLNLPVNVTSGQLVNTFQVTLSGSTLTSSDTTSISTSPTPETPNFSIFVNCVTVSATTYTAYFGYLNRLTTNQVLDSSFLLPSGSGTPVSTLISGRRDKVFSATAANDVVIVWNATAGSVTGSAIANTGSPLCSLAAPNLGVSPVNSTTLNINWNRVDGATSYEVYRNNNLIAQVGSTSYNDINLQPSTTYTYTARAIGPNITSAFSSPVSEKTPSGSAPPESAIPDFSIYINCIDLNSDNTYTIYFGYQNNRSVNQSLDLSFYTPALATSPTQLLLSGRYDKAFTAKATVGNTVVWTAGANGINRTATASSGLTRCQIPQGPVDGPTPTPTDGTTKVDVNENPVALEIVDFYEGNIKISSDCSTKRLVINGDVAGNVSFTSIQYSIDGGNKWTNIGNTKGLATSSLTYSVLTRALRDQLYGIKIRVTTSSNTTNESRTLSYLQNCTGKGNILGSYFKNGSGPGINSNSGQLLYNEFMPLVLYVETLGNISALKIKISQDKDFQTNVTDLSSVFDFASGIWAIEIPSEYFVSETNYIKLEAKSGEKTLSKELAEIINTAFLQTSYSEKDSSTDYKYQLYFFDGVGWQAMDYDNEINTTIKNAAYKEFNLASGTFYFKVTYPSGIDFYSSRFFIAEPSIVRINTYQTSGIWIVDFMRSLVEELSINIFTRNTLNESASVKSDAEFEFYQSLIANKIPKSKADFQAMVFYWNSWSPLLKDQLANLNKINTILINRGLTNRKIYIVTDDNNIENLKRILKINKFSLEYFEITNDQFLDQKIRYQKEFTIISTNESSINQIRGDLNFNDLLKELIKLDYIK